MNDSSMVFLPLTSLMSRTGPASHPVAFDHDGLVSWGQFSSDVQRLTTYLRSHPADRVAICARDSYWFAVGFIALTHSNKAIILPGNHQPAALEELSGQFDLLLTDRPAELALPVTRMQNIQAQEAPLLPEINTNRVQVTLFTSGSSGKPKAIPKTLSQLETEISILENLFGDSLSGSVIESTVSHQHIYGLLFRLLWPLCAGRPFARLNLEFPEQVVAHAGQNITLISSPALLKRLSKESASRPVRQIFSSGGPLPYDAAQHCKALMGHWPTEVFGSTETGGIAWRRQQDPKCAWRLFPGVEASLNSERCLRLRSPHIDPDNWYQTADECELTRDGQFILKGRTDRIIKVEEKRISLLEVEKRLEQLDWIRECAVIPFQEPERLSLVAVLVVTEQGHEELERDGKGQFWLQLRRRLRQWLEPVAIPRRFRIVTEIPLNSQGKRQIAEIEKLFSNVRNP